MKKKFSFKSTAILLTVLFVFAMCPLSASALKTTLTTTVPSNFSVELKIEGEGKVKIGNKIYSENTVIALQRNEWCSFAILPEDTSEIKSVFYNGEDVTQKLENNVLAVLGDKNSTLTITFVKKGQSPITGDRSHLTGALCLLIFSATMLMILSKKKEQSR